MKRIFCIDIGNSSTSIGIIEDNEAIEKIKFFKISNDYICPKTLHEKLLQCLEELFITSNKNSHFVIASVVPEKNKIWMDFSLKFFKTTPFFIQHHYIKDVKNLYDNPEKLGIDRLINAYSAIKKYNTNCIVIDFGTATTFDCINSQWEFLGGLIIPGIETMFQSLHHKTSQLPLILDYDATENCLCRDTMSAIKNGVILGYVDMTNGLINRIKKQMPQPTKIISTGGLGGLIKKYCTEIEEYIPALTLEGIYLVYKNYLNFYK